ncbi:MAG: hypothetical protein ACJAX4_001251 [Clostridium sp.]|jgi:hypothetical protein
MPLLEKYQDYETSTVNEPIEKIINKINQQFTDYYIIKSDSLLEQIYSDANEWRVLILVLTLVQ